MITNWIKLDKFFYTNSLISLFTASPFWTHTKKKASEPPSNIPFCAVVQFSRDSIRVFNDPVNIDVCDQSTVQLVCMYVKLYLDTGNHQ